VHDRRISRTFVFFSLEDCVSSLSFCSLSRSDRIEFKVVDAIQNDKPDCATSRVSDNVAGFRLILLMWRDINKIGVRNSKAPGVRDQSKRPKGFWFKMVCQFCPSHESLFLQRVLVDRFSHFCWSEPRTNSPSLIPHADYPERPEADVIS
jgi:hypothetical protein